MNMVSPKRRYRQGVRAAAAEATGERIVGAFAAALAERWFDEIRLEDVAREAGVTVQTVIRRFGTKEGLLAPAAERIGAEVRQRRARAIASVAAAVAALAKDYEVSGDLVLRILAQEDRHPALRAMADTGRAGQRAWLDQAFALWLDRLDAGARSAALDALVAVTDVYVWKLYRRDMKRSVGQYRAAVERLAGAAFSSGHQLKEPEDDR
jgi:AcrR family transcriptional regulator